jgi:hypothetical protein
VSSYSLSSICIHIYISLTDNYLTENLTNEWMSFHYHFKNLVWSNRIGKIVTIWTPCQTHRSPLVWSLSLETTRSGVGQPVLDRFLGDRRSLYILNKFYPGGRCLRCEWEGWQHWWCTSNSLIASFELMDCIQPSGTWKNERDLVHKDHFCFFGRLCLLWIDKGRGTEKTWF